MVAAKTRSRSTTRQRPEEEPPLQEKAVETEEHVSATGIMRNSDMLIELHKQRDEIMMLKERAAASEERAFHTTSSAKELQDQHVSEMEVMRTKMNETLSRLANVERSYKSLFRALKKTKLISAKPYVIAEEEQQHTNTMQNAYVDIRDDDDDTRSVTSSVMRAEGLMEMLEDARSDVASSVISRGYCVPSSRIQDRRLL